MTTLNSEEIMDTTYNVGPAPDFLSADAKTAWADLVAIAPPGKWLISDSIMLEITADFVAEFRNNELFNEEQTDLLADVLAKMLLGPYHFEILLSLTYPKPWPDTA
jgi:hypothetical protein